MKNFLARKGEKGITLIALVITIIVLLILAAVTINLTIGERGIFTIAQIAAKNYTNAQNRELASLDVYDTEIKDTLSILGTGWNASKKVNAPKLADGLTPVVINDNGTITEVGQYDSNWYDYENKKWANAQSKDGSLWVWIPRYAYKIKYSNADDRSAGGTIEVVFLKGTSDEAENGKNIVRATDENIQDKYFDNKGLINGQDVYIVHPAFCDGSSNGYKNGEWNSEILGFWMAKFEAGVTFSNSYNTEIPSFKANQLSAIRTTDQAYEMCRSITSKGSKFGLDSVQTNSHLCKNSEWGAVTYLTYSKFGVGENSSKNCVKVNSKYREGTSVTGITGNNSSGVSADSLDELLKNGNIYDWTNKEHCASTTGNITGIYDMNGGLWNLVAACTYDYTEGNGFPKCYPRTKKYALLDNLYWRIYYGERSERQR